MGIIRRIRLWGTLVLASMLLVACALQISHSTDTAIPARPSDTLRVATHNAHYIILSKETGAWSVADWNERAPAMDAAFKAVDADIIAYQEMESFSGGDSDDVNLARSYLADRNPDYSIAAIGDWREFPSTQPIFYRSARLTLLDQGWFFFSDTPDVIYSRTFNGSWPAFASWAEFLDRQSGKRLAVMNLHFEYKSASNRLQSAALVVDRTAPLAARNDAVILLADLNAVDGSETMEILETAGYRFAPVDGATYHMNRGVNLFGAIDHIATIGAVEPANAPVIVQQKFAGDWPSDHYPVLMDLRLVP